MPVNGTPISGGIRAVPSQTPSDASRADANTSTIVLQLGNSTKLARQLPLPSLRA